MANFVSYENAEVILTDIGDKLRAVNGAYVLRGSVAFANLPASLTKTMTGYVYNVTNEFTTDARFIEGAGKKYSAGTNVAVADIGGDTYTAVTPAGTENPAEEGWYEESGGVYTLTEDTTVDETKTYYRAVHTPDMKFDVIGAFVDVDGITARIDAVSDMITAEEFDDTEAYSIGDIVKHEDALYKFKAAHAAGAWDASEVDSVTVLELIEAAEPDSLTTAQVNALLALLE